MHTFVGVCVYVLVSIKCCINAHLITIQTCMHTFIYTYICLHFSLLQHYLPIHLYGVFAKQQINFRHQHTYSVFACNFALQHVFCCCFPIFFAFTPKQLTKLIEKLHLTVKRKVYSFFRHLLNNAWKCLKTSYTKYLILFYYFSFALSQFICLTHLTVVCDILK